jgi:tagaturonate reductase
MQLNKTNLKSIKAQPGLTIPEEKLVALPEKVLQFGTGVLLRGLPDYFIDKANRQGIFNGRVVVVKSTSSGGTDAFTEQDGLYTINIRGIENGKQIQEAVINSSISRVLSACEEWKEIIACAHNADMQVIISNTTEVGIVLAQEDKITDAPPSSFPGKLLAFLYERYKAFNGSAESGMVIIPTELIIDNGKKLQTIVLELAKNNQLEDSFIQWIQTVNHFCNSLVDRIVPGKLPDADKKTTEENLGYTDELMIMAECFRLWAIESASEKVKEVLSFSTVDAGVVITPDIEKFRELKLRLLNGTHTFSCGLAFLAGFETVKEAMADEEMMNYVRRLMLLEIAPALDNKNITYNEACAFVNSVLDRFRNPFLDHRWISITLNFTSKMKLRNVPLLLKHYTLQQSVPAHMALGFAAYILFMKAEQNSTNHQYTGTLKETSYVIQDDQAANLAKKWKSANVVEAVLADTALWGEDLSVLPGFAQAVKENLSLLQTQDVLETISQFQTKKTPA